MTKREQIEEMKRLIKYGFENADCRQLYTNKPYPYFDSQICNIADILYNMGYRRIPDGYYVELKTADDMVKETNELFDEMERIRKQTAKEIFNAIVENRDEPDCILMKYNKWFQSLAKQYDFEVEE